MTKAMKTIKKSIFALSMFLILIVSTGIASAMILVPEYQDGGSSLSIKDGESATFKVRVYSDPPLTINVGLYSGDTQIYDYYSGSHGGALFNQAYTVLPSHYLSTGIYYIKVSASDGAGDFMLKSLSLTVTSANNAPLITSSPVTTAGREQLYSYQVTATDADGDILTWSLTTAPAGMSISSNGLITWTPSSLQKGSHTISIQVSDGISTAVQSFTLNVDNNAPVLSSISDIEVDEGDEVRVRAYATDSDGDTITYSISSSKFDKVGDNIFEWETDNDDDGDYRFTVTASDGALTDTETFEVEVNKKSSKDKDVRITEVTLTPDEVYAGDSVIVRVEVENYGNDDEEDLKIEVSNAELGISDSSSYFDLDEDDEATKTLNIIVPESSEEGSYVLEVSIGDSVRYKMLEVNAEEVEVAEEEEKESNALAITAIILGIAVIALIVYLFTNVYKLPWKSLNK